MIIIDKALHPGWCKVFLYEWSKKYDFSRFFDMDLGMKRFRTKLLREF